MKPKPKPNAPNPSDDALDRLSETRRTAEDVHGRTTAEWPIELIERARRAPIARRSQPDMGTLRMPQTPTLERPTSGTRRAVTREELDRAMAWPHDRATPPPPLPVPSPLSPLSPFIALPAHPPLPEARTVPTVARRRFRLLIVLVVTVAVALGAMVGFLLGRLSL